MDEKRCSRCKMSRNADQFISKRGDTNTKMCLECRSREILRCEHDRQKHHCRECRTGLCIHDKHKYSCKRCLDPMKLTILEMLRGSKASDRKKDRYDANNFVDKCFIEMLMDESLECHYCSIEMQLIDCDDTLCTIERLDNRIGHTKANCVLACRKCNFRHQGPGTYKIST